MNIDVIRQAAENYADESFVQPLNSFGEPMTMPPGQTVPHGYRQHCKVAKKHFIAGVFWHQNVTSITVAVVEPSKHACPFMSMINWIKKIGKDFGNFIIRIVCGKV